MAIRRWLAALGGLALSGLPALGQSAGVAILDSNNTRNFFAAHYPPCNPAAGSFYLGADEYQRYFRGWEYVVKTELGLDADIIHDEDVTAAGLAGYKLLILSNTASLSDAQAKAISQWVIRGGRLLATFGSGYKSIVHDPREEDGLKLQKGGTFGLHQLWHDPMSKMFSSLAITPGIDVRITDFSGPAACLAGQLSPDGVLDYGALGNMLIQRPLEFHGASGFLAFSPQQWSRPAPAILTSRIGHGLVVYYAFAPEYIVSKEFDLPVGNACPDGQDWARRSAEGRVLMQCTVNYLLGN